MNLSSKQKGILALVGLAAIYALMGIFARSLAVDFKLFQQIYLRILSAVIIGFIVFGKNFNISKLKKISSKEWLLIIFRSISYYLFGIALFTKAVLLTKISTVSFISSIPMTAIFGFIVLKEKITFNKIFYILLAFTGVIIISVKDFSSLLVWGMGEQLALASCVICSLAIIFRKYHTKLLNNNEITQLMLIVASIALFITSFLMKEGLPITNWNINILLIIVIAGLANVLMMLFTNIGFEKVQTSLASNILTLEMFFAVIFGFLFYHEVPAAKEIGGGLLILLSIVQMNKLDSGKT